MSRWRVRVAATAERDFVSIIEWTVATFGPRQASVYRRTIMAALTALQYGPDLSDTVARDEILPGVRSLHVARRGRRGRHFVLYRSAQPRTVEVLRILHDAMDLARHIS